VNGRGSDGVDVARRRGVIIIVGVAGASASTTSATDTDIEAAGAM
jgi:Tfp pilus assembly ATPase PilU